MIDWFVYWFMLPACIAIVSLAMMLGIDGTAILTPVVILVFPIFSVPAISPGAAVAAGLFTEFFGFVSGVIGYAREGLIDYNVGLRLSVFAVPVIIVASLLAQFSPALVLKLVFGVLMAVLAAYLLLTSKSTVRNAHLETTPASADAFPRIRESPEETVIQAKNGREYHYQVCDRTRGEAICAIGSAFEGMISVGLGELLMPDLIRRCKIPVEVSAATSVFVMAVAVFAGSAAGIASLAIKGGASAIPWNLLLFTIPGAIIGGQVGSKAQGVLSSLTTERLIVAIFSVVGASFLYVSAVGLMGHP